MPDSPVPNFTELKGTPEEHQSGEMPPFWRETPERIAQFRELQLLATVDRLHTYWRERWVFGEGEEPPFPFHVTARDDQPTRTTLRRLDELAIPYRVYYGNQYAPELAGTISAPLWDHRIGVLAGTDAAGTIFGLGSTDDGFRSLDDFFSCFRPRR